MSINLSYILTTYNKVAYLKITLPFLIKACKADEEIVVVDGGSTDGTVLFLQQLKNEGKIHQFISEKDSGESHGTNKALLMARGEVIKIITDDDAYSFNGIEKCKNFMISNPDIDLLGFNGYGFHISSKNPFFQKKNLDDVYRNWKATKQPFIFCGLSLLIRKSSIPILGLFNCSIKMIDVEYTLRVTASKTKLAWYTGFGYANIANENSVSNRFWKTDMLEREKLNYLYLDKLPFILFKNKDSFKEIFRPIKRMIFGKPIINNQVDFEEAFLKAYNKVNNTIESEGSFIV